MGLAWPVAPSAVVDMMPALRPSRSLRRKPSGGTRCHMLAYVNHVGSYPMLKGCEASAISTERKE